MLVSPASEHSRSRVCLVLALVISDSVCPAGLASPSAQ